MNAVEQELSKVIAYTRKGLGLHVGHGDFKLIGKNIKGIDSESPLADYVMDFETLPDDSEFDFVLMRHYLRNCKSVIETLRKAITVLKPGGFILIIDKNEPDKTARHYFNGGECEGLLDLFSKFVQIDQKGIIEGTDSYYFVGRKKGETNATKTPTEKEL